MSRIESELAVRQKVINALLLDVRHASEGSVVLEREVVEDRLRQALGVSNEETLGRAWNDLVNGGLIREISNTNCFVIPRRRAQAELKQLEPKYPGSVC